MTSLGQTQPSVRSRQTASNSYSNANQQPDPTYAYTPGNTPPAFSNPKFSPSPSSSSHYHAHGPSMALGKAKGGKFGPSPTSGLGLGVNPGTGSSFGSGSVVGATRAEIKIIAALVLIAFLVRFWKIGQPSSVVFDEVHFGGFASKYIKGKFFMDVHPPLAKLLITFSGWAAGFNGGFDFKDIGREYLIGQDTPVPYVAMRSLGALLGVATIPLAYMTIRALSMRATTALVGALLITFENGLVTQSRLILLDSPLIFFTALTIFFWVTFCNEEKRAPFSKSWWAWLSLTGLSLGAVVSSKWVGLFTIATVGVSTIAQLWEHLGDVRQPVRVVARHFVARAICLIVLPVLVYMFTFSIHLALLNRSGDGDSFMSAAFQHTLRGHGMRDTFADVALGSSVSIKHLNTQGGYLHSHVATYPAGSQQQQITLYPHVDENNEWIIVKAPGPHDPAPKLDEKGHPVKSDDETERYKHQPLEFLQHGMEVRLIHKMTDKRLHSHDTHRPPITESDYQNEVTGYGFPGFGGDANDNFHVEIYSGEKTDKVSSKRVRALRSHFRLRHTLTGCYLFSHKIALPEWGFGQQEVTCNKNPTLPNSLWYVETNTHPKLVSGQAEMVNYIRPSFYSKFIELQRVMWETNAGLTERHAYDSRPQSWPLLKRGINFWTKDHRQIYLIGNPFVWWGSTAAVLAYLGARALLMLRAKRGYRDFHDSTIVFYDQTCGFLTLGWALHYFPFFLMNRQLFLHHYFPALYFSVLVFASIFDFASSMLRPRFRLQVAIAVVVIAILAYSKYTPITYASEWTAKGCESARLLKGWDFNCREYPDDVSMFKQYPPGIQTIDTSSRVTGQSQFAPGTTSKIEGMAPLVAEPGRHAFENKPAQAAQSNGILQELGHGHVAEAAGALKHKIEELAQGFKHAQPDAAGGAAPPAPAPVVEQPNGGQQDHIAKQGNPLAPQPGPGPGGAPVQGGAGVPASSQVDTGAGDDAGGAAAKGIEIDPAGLNQDQFEAAILEGTAKAVAEEIKANATPVRKEDPSRPSAQAILNAHADEEAHEAADGIMQGIAKDV